MYQGYLAIHCNPYDHTFLYHHCRHVIQDDPLYLEINQKLIFLKFEIDLFRAPFIPGMPGVPAEPLSPCGPLGGGPSVSFLYITFPGRPGLPLIEQKLNIFL